MHRYTKDTILKKLFPPVLLRICVSVCELKKSQPKDREKTQTGKRKNQDEKKKCQKNKCVVRKFFFFPLSARGPTRSAGATLLGWLNYGVDGQLNYLGEILDATCLDGCSYRPSLFSTNQPTMRKQLMEEASSSRSLKGVGRGENRIKNTIPNPTPCAYLMHILL